MGGGILQFFEDGLCLSGGYFGGTLLDCVPCISRDVHVQSTAGDLVGALAARGRAAVLAFGTLFSWSGVRRPLGVARDRHERGSFWLWVCSEGGACPEGGAYGSAAGGHGARRQSSLRVSRVGERWKGEVAVWAACRTAVAIRSTTAVGRRSMSCSQTRITLQPERRSFRKFL